MDMPRPTEAHARIERFAGIWTGEEIMYPSLWDPKGGTAQGRRENRVGLGGFVVIGDYEQKRNGQLTFAGHEVHTYDTNQQCHVLYWFDSMGMPPNVFKGNFEGDLLTLICNESCEGPAPSSRGTYDLSEPGRLKSTMEVSQDGKNWMLLMKGNYRREDQ